MGMMNRLILCIFSAAVSLWPAVILLQKTLEHLYIDHTYLHDIGYWISLSTAANPLLIEPASLHAGYSYFNTHFSPIFLILQVIFNVIHGNNPPLFFSCWFWFLGIIPIVIAITTTLCQTIGMTRRRLYQQIAILVVAAVSTYAYVSSNTWQNSFINYLHPEIIGMQLIGTGWLILAFNEINFRTRFHSERHRRSVQTGLGVTLILLGSFFHELIAAMAIVLLISIKLYRKSSVQFQDFWSIKEPAVAIAACLTGWFSLKSFGFFPGSSQIDSALTRIYLGSPAFDHVNPEIYLNNLQDLISRNQLSIIFLFASLVISSAVDKRGARLILLPSIPLMAYGLLSPFAVYNKAATLAGHYNYPLSLSFFFLLFSFSHLIQSRQASQNVTSRPRVIPAALLILLLLIPLGQLTISEQRIKVFNPDSLNSLGTSQRIKRKSLTDAKQFNLGNSIRNLWTISVDSNHAIQTLSANPNLQFSSIQAAATPSSGEGSQQTIVLVDHAFAALYPNLIGQCNLINPTRQQCLEKIATTNKNANLAFLSMQPRDSLDIEMVQRYLTLLNLKERTTINVGRYLNQDYQITLLSRQQISSASLTLN